MPLSVIAHTISGTNNNSTTSSSINTSGASLLVVAIAYYAGAPPPTLSDLVGASSNTWVPLTSYSSGIGVVKIYYAVNPVVGSGHTFTLSGTGTFPALSVIALGGANTASPFDVENGSISSYQPGSVTPSEGNEVLITATIDNATGAICNTIDEGFTIADSVVNSLGNYFGLALAYLIETSATAKNPTWSGGSGSAPCSAIATFKAATSGSIIIPVFMQHYAQQGQV